MPSPTTARMRQVARRRRRSGSALRRSSRANARSQHALGARRLRLRDRAADRMLGAALRDQDHRDALLAQRAEQAMRRAGHADHAGALEVDQRDVLDAGDALDRQARDVGCAQISVPGFSRREGVADPDRDVAADGRRHGLRMDDLGAEVRQLHRLVVGQRVDDLRVGHAARIGRQHAVDVGPDVDLARRPAARRRSRRRNRCRCGRASSARRAGRWR